MKPKNDKSISTMCKAEKSSYCRSVPAVFPVWFDKPISVLCFTRAWLNPFINRDLQFIDQRSFLTHYQLQMISLHVAICSSVHQGSMSTRPFEPRPRRDARLGDRDETETLGILSETRPRWDVAAPETLAKRYGENHWKWQNFIYGWTKLVSTMVSAFCFVILWVFLHRGSSNRSSFVSHGVCVCVAVVIFL